jgi:hypothetical protein
MCEYNDHSGIHAGFGDLPESVSMTIVSGLNNKLGSN